MRLDIADLQLFICISDAGSISGGAIKANLALSSASERLRHIERDAGVQLLTRYPRGVSLTEAGEVFVRHARQILDQHSLLKNELKTFTDRIQGTLRLYANTSALTEFLPSKVSHWLNTHPEFHIELEERSSADIIKSISADLGDVGIVSNAVDPQTLHLEPVRDDHLSLIIPCNHPLANEQVVFLKEIIHEPFVGFYMGSALQTHIDAHAAALGHLLKLRIRMNTFEGMCEMVSHGIGLGILPEIIADKFQHRFKYKKLALMDIWAQRQLCLCYKDWNALSAPMQNLLNALKSRN